FGARALRLGLLALQVFQARAVDRDDAGRDESDRKQRDDRGGGAVATNQFVRAVRERAAMRGDRQTVGPAFEIVGERLRGVVAFARIVGGRLGDDAAEIALQGTSQPIDADTALLRDALGG